jgi:hypothetical protein
VFTIKQQNKEVIEIPVPSLAKIEKEKGKRKKASWIEFDLEMICCLSNGNNQNHHSFPLIILLLCGLFDMQV